MDDIIEPASRKAPTPPPAGATKPDPPPAPPKKRGMTPEGVRELKAGRPLLVGIHHHGKWY